MLIDVINNRYGVNALYCGTDVILCDNKKKADSILSLHNSKDKYKDNKQQYQRPY